MKFSVKIKLVLLCSLFIAVFIPLTLMLLKRSKSILHNFNDVVTVTEAVIGKAHTIEKLIIDLETGQRGFIITGKSEFLEPYDHAAKEFDIVLNNLRKLLRERPEHLQTLEKIEQLRYKWDGVAGGPEIQLRRRISQTALNLKSINQLIQRGTGKQILDEIRAVLDEMQQTFNKRGRKDALIWLTQLGKDVVDSETGERGFLLTGDDDFLEPYYIGQASFKSSSKKLKSFLGRDRDTLQRLTQVENLYQDWLIKAARPEIQARVKYERDPRSMEDLAIVLGSATGKNIIDQLRPMLRLFITDLEQENKKMLAESQQSSSFDYQLSYFVLSIGTMLSLLIAGLLGASILRPIKDLMEGIKIFGQGNLNHRIHITSKDELALLGDNFNEMVSQLQITIERDQDRAIELETAYNELQDTQSQLLQSQKMESIGKLAGGIAHDFNNLLGGMLGYADLLRTEFKDNERVSKWLGIIIKSTERAADLTQKLLGFARQGKYESKKFNINETIEEACNLLNRSGAKTMVIREELDQELWPIEGDSTQIMQILMNLGINARDAMPDGGELIIETQNINADETYCKIHIRLTPGSYVRVSVTDTGEGIPAEIIDKVFDPFFTTKEIGKGTGLGLSMAYGIMENHGGLITVYSQVNRGTVFHLYFPAITEGIPIEVDVSTDPEMEEVRIDKTILIVDDEEIMRELAIDSLQDSGAEILIAKNGEEALNLHESHRDKIDLTILDIVMPIIDGLTVHRELSKANQEIKVLFSSGYTESDEIRELRKTKAGTVSFIQKPFKKHDLLKEIVRLV